MRFGPFLLLYAPPQDTLFSTLKKRCVKVVVWTGIQELQVSLGGLAYSFKLGLEIYIRHSIKSFGYFRLYLTSC